MTMDSHEVLQKIDAHLELHINATLQAVSETLGLSGREIEQILSEVEHTSFQELQENKRMSQAFKILGVRKAPPSVLWKDQRSRQRIFAPWTTVKYSVHSYGICESIYSKSCPVASLNINGMGFLADDSLKPGNMVSLLLTLPKGKEELPVKGYIIHSVETDIADFSYHLGIQFLPFIEWKNCNSPKVYDALVKFEKDYQIL